MLYLNNEPISLEDCAELIRTAYKPAPYSMGANVPNIEDYVVPKESITTQLDVPVIKMDSVALQRIIDEVKNAPLPRRKRI